MKSITIKVNDDLWVLLKKAMELEHSTITEFTRHSLRNRINRIQRKYLLTPKQAEKALDEVKKQELSENKKQPIS